MQDFVEYTPTRALIVEAIKDGLVLDCQYLSDEGRIETIRQIHPATFGYGENGELYLRVFHKKGESFSLGRELIYRGYLSLVDFKSFFRMVELLIGYL